MLEAGGNLDADVQLKHVLFLASIVVTWASIAVCSEADYCKDYFGWAVACSLISSFFLLLLHIPVLGSKLDGLSKPISAFFCAWWIVGVITMTFKSPFTFAGNGFFGAWVAGLSAVGLFRHHWHNEIQSLTGGSTTAESPPPTYPSTTGGVANASNSYTPPVAGDSAMEEEKEER